MLQKIDENIWLCDGSTVSWFGMSFTTRMTIIRLDSGKLWIHSPVKVSEEIVKEVQELGEVGYLISPNKIHHLFIQDWLALYPDAKAYSSPGLEEKRKDIQFDSALTDTAETDWENEIEQLIFKGSRVMEEVVFFHKKSRTLILADLIENFHPNYLTGFRKAIAKIGGVVSPNGRTPLDWRATFIFNKAKARGSLQVMLNWQPERIVISHGECIDTDALAFLKRSFSWL
ncbi:MAG: hypothetical protein CSA49_02125 [Gammaproteobacteria bacterium]|nr:MAG: hypothetical protein CSA49_02125 [Gammaproteobacteria bacterium]